MTMTNQIFSFIPDQLFLDVRDLIVEKILVSMPGEFILQSDIIPLVSYQYSNSDAKQSIPHFDENESNSLLHNIRKYFFYCIHKKSYLWHSFKAKSSYVTNTLFYTEYRLF